MSATTIRELFVKFGVDASQVDQGLERVDKAIDSAKSRLTELVTVAAAATTALVALGGAALYQASETAKDAIAIRRQAEALGLSTDAYQKLVYAIERYGGQQQDVGDAMTQLAGQQQAAVRGSTDMAKSFEQLGISAERLAELSPEELFLAVADGLGKTSDEATRLQLSNQVLGGGLSQKLLPLLAQGKEALGALGGEAERLGVVMSEDALEASSQLGDKLAELTVTGEALRQKIGIALTPAVNELADRLLKWVDANQEVIDSKIDEYAKAIGDAFVAVSDAIGAANEVVGGAEGWTKLAEVMAGLAAVGGVAYVAIQFGLLIAALVSAFTTVAGLVGGGVILVAVLAAVGTVVAYLAAVFAVWSTAIAAVTLVIEDFWTYMEGGDSVFGRLIDKWREAPGLLGAISRALSAFGDLVGAVFGLAGIFLDSFMDGIQPAVDAVWSLGVALTDGVGWALDKLAPVLDFVTGKMQALTGMLQSEGAKQVAAGAGTGVSALAAGAGSSTFAGGRGRSGAEFAASGSSGKAGAGAKSVQVGGNTISISGVGMTMEQVTEMIRQSEEQKQRATADALAGAEL